MTEINWDLLQRLAVKPHPLLNIEDDFEAQLASIPAAWVAEVIVGARTAHHLLDLVLIPHGEGYSSDLDARTWQLVVKSLEQQDRLERLASWHSRDDLPGGLVGKYCRECETVWPCDSYRLATGGYVDPQERQGVPA